MTSAKQPERFDYICFSLSVVAVNHINSVTGKYFTVGKVSEIFETDSINLHFSVLLQFLYLHTRRSRLPSSFFRALCRSHR